MKVQIEDVRKLMEEKLAAKGLSGEDAAVIADEYLDGELRGRHSHGLMSFPNAIKRAKEITGPIQIEKDGPAYALVNGNGNPGQLVGKFMMELAIKKARGAGVAIVGSYNHPSYLMPGYQVRRAMKEGLIGIVIDNSKAAVVPHGGIDPVYGPNPIGIGIPSKTTPIVVDMATSVHAKGDTRYAKKFGKLLPENYALDKEGNTTRDPDEFYALLPFGGHKGYCLGLAIEVLAGPMVNAKVGTDEGSRGFMFQVIDPSKFVGQDEFEEKVARLAEQVKSSRKADGVEEIFLPGEHSERIKQENLKNGFIEVDDKLWEEIKAL